MNKIFLLLSLMFISSIAFGKSINLECSTLGNISQTVIVDFDKKIINGLDGKWNKGEFSESEISWYQTDEYGKSLFKLNRYTGILSVKIIDGPLAGVGGGVHSWKCNSVQQKKF